MAPPALRTVWDSGCDTFGDRVLPLLMTPLTWGSSVVTRVEADTPVLTFDDGPHPESTPALLDVLAEHETTATFFLVGQQAAKHPALVRRITDAGHAIGNHSWSHRSPLKRGPAAMRTEYERTQSLVEELTAQACRLVRPPFGILTPALFRFARSQQSAVWLWSRMPPDYRPGSSAASIARRLYAAKPCEIVCLHDNEASRHRTPAVVARYLSERRRLRELAATGLCYPAGHEARHH